MTLTCCDICLGEVLEISGITTRKFFGNSVPSSLGCLLRFENDVICTLSASDEVVSQVELVPDHLGLRRVLKNKPVVYLDRRH